MGLSDHIYIIAIIMQMSIYRYKNYKISKKSQNSIDIEAIAV